MRYKHWTPKLRKYIVRQAQAGITPISDIAKYRKVPRRTIYYLINKFRKGGFANLIPKPRGRKKDSLNHKFIELVVSEWKQFKCGSHKMWLRLKARGFTVSERKIQAVYKENGFKLNNRSRPSQIKFVKYEYPIPNMLWHTDWSHDPRTNQNIIAFIDDCTRLLVHAEIFAHSTTENTILAFKNAIAKYGKPDAILTDNGTQFTPAKTEKGPFSEFCEQNGIKHILGRIHHPQTNGKVERWFGTYKLEFDERFTTLNQFIRFYNEDRIHQGIGYLTPQEKWNKLKSVQIN